MPKRTIRRFSSVTVRSGGKMRRLVVIVPAQADVLLVREEGRRCAYELSILRAYQVAVMDAAARARAERKAKKR